MLEAKGKKNSLGLTRLHLNMILCQNLQSPERQHFLKPFLVLNLAMFGMLNYISMVYCAFIALALISVTRACVEVNGTTKITLTTKNSLTLVDNGRIICHADVNEYDGYVPGCEKGYSAWFETGAPNDSIFIKYTTPHGSRDFTVEKECETYNCCGGLFILSLFYPHSSLSFLFSFLFLISCNRKFPLSMLGLRFQP